MTTKFALIFFAFAAAANVASDMINGDAQIVAVDERTGR